MAATTQTFEMGVQADHNDKDLLLPDMLDFDKEMQGLDIDPLDEYSPLLYGKKKSTSNVSVANLNWLSELFFSFDNLDLNKYK